ncbi:hypothetical protein ACJX0J_019351, partial [Zea mays]
MSLSFALRVLDFSLNITFKVVETVAYKYSLLSYRWIAFTFLQFNFIKLTSQILNLFCILRAYLAPLFMLYTKPHLENNISLKTTWASTLRQTCRKHLKSEGLPQKDQQLSKIFLPIHRYWKNTKTLNPKKCYYCNRSQYFSCTASSIL